MNSSSFLNADMATVGSWLRGGWRWWTNEIAAIVPASLRKMGQQNSPHAVFRDERIDFRDGSRAQPSGRARSTLLWRLHNPCNGSSISPRWVFPTFEA